MSQLAELTGGPFEHILVETRDAVATITLNRPEVLNACNSATHRELQRAIEAVENHAPIRAVVVAGAGRSFCAGADINEVGTLHGPDARRYIRLDYATKNRMAGCAKPTVAAIHGHCIGGGLELALACDLRVAAEDASFAFGEIRLGTIPGAGGLQRLPAVVGLGVAKEWVLTGRTVDATEAYRTGLVNRVVAPSDLLRAARELASTLAARNPLALRLAKAALDPQPPSDTGLTATFHELASQVCHEEPSYLAQAARFISNTGQEGPDGRTDRGSPHVER